MFIREVVVEAKPIFDVEIIGRIRLVLRKEGIADSEGEVRVTDRVYAANAVLVSHGIAYAIDPAGAAERVAPHVERSLR